MARTLEYGKRVEITGGMSEFIGATGYIASHGYEDARDRLYRVRLDRPVMIEGVGLVQDDLWGPDFLKPLRG